MTKKKDIKIKFMPYEKLNSRSLHSILEEVKKDTIILVDAKLRPEEESMIIKKTMESISDKFAGVELRSIDIGTKKKKDKDIAHVLREKLFELISGKKRGMTVIGNASLIKKIEQDPDKLLLHMS